LVFPSLLPLSSVLGDFGLAVSVRAHTVKRPLGAGEPIIFAVTTTLLEMA
jgi:hypothetical protein